MLRYTVSSTAPFGPADCASDYGNEVEVGAGIAAGVAELGLTRDDIFVTSKLWNTNHRPEHVREACELTLKDLGLKYLDLYLIHFPIAMVHIDGDATTRSWAPRDASGAVIFDKVPLQDTWRAMEALVDAGLVRAVAASSAG
jgi:D-xylose reductase